MKVPDEYAYLNTNTLAAEGQQPFEHTQQPHNSMPRSNQVNSMPRSNHKVARICCRLDPPSTAGPNNMRAIPRKIPACPTGRPAPALLGPARQFLFPPYLSLKSNTVPHFCYFFASAPSKKQRQKLGWLDRADRQHAYRLNLLPSVTGRGGGGQPQRWGRAWNK